MCEVLQTSTLNNCIYPTSKNSLYLGAEATKEGKPKMAQCKCKILVEKVPQKFAHAIV